MKSFLGGASPLYQAQESSLLLMQAKCWACLPYMAFSITQSVHRHSEGLLIRQGREVQRVIWGPKKRISKCTWHQTFENWRPILRLYLALAAQFVALGQALLLCGAGGLPELDEVTQGDVHRAVGLQLACSGARTHRGEGEEGEGWRAGWSRSAGRGPTCDEILLAISLQRHPTHGGGGGRVDGINVLVGTLEHLWEKNRKECQIRAGINTTVRRAA